MIGALSVDLAHAGSQPTPRHGYSVPGRSSVVNFLASGSKVPESKAL